MEFLKITNSADIPLEIKDLYQASFPEAERRDWADIERRIESGDPIFNFYVLQHNSQPIGFITLWRLPGALYCEHFAILYKMRGNGFGREVVKTALTMAGDAPFILEVELPETSFEALRRIDFYKRCGMEALEEFPYWQPPYRRDLPEVPMMLMSSKTLPDPTSVAMILHTIVYNQ